MLKRAAVGTLTLSLLFGAGCSGVPWEHVKAAATNVLLSQDQEKQLGTQVHTELSRQVRYVNDPTVTQYVHDVAESVLAAAKRDQPDLSVDIYVIDDLTKVNAFATPGKQLYVFTGLLMAAESDAQVAGVLGHECGHIVAGHPARQMVAVFGVRALTQAVLGRNPSIVEKVVASVVNKGYLLANSRADETAADEYGARYASAAGYDPNALGEYLTAISAKSGEPSGVAAWLSDHPTTPDRVAHLREYATEHDLQGSDVGQRLRVAQARLRGQAPNSAHGGGP